MLERMATEAEEKYRDRPVPRPENWGGYYLDPDHVEFWQGREHRLHDRLQYIRTASEGGWTIRLLYP
jgi:pyridoxamine 5'-phosphate oxidase